jgi:hypothetical protein
MDQDALVKDQIDAGQRFLVEFAKYAPVKLAAWLKEIENGRWYLYVVSDSVRDRDVSDAYGHVVRVVNDMNPPRLDPFRIRIVGANTSLASQVLGFQQYATTTTTTPPPWFEPPVSGIDSAYVYNLPIETSIQ